MRKDMYPPANRTAQWYAKLRPGRIMPGIDKVVLHTTEGSGWPSYNTGAVAPTFTCLPNKTDQVLVWRQHFPINMSSRALENRIGGVETNTDNAVQVELVGTCDPKGPSGAMFWPGATDWALIGLARFLKFMNEEWDVPLQVADLWLPYPISYGRTRARMSFDEWNGFRGICGHQHVPENVHGDPGNINFRKILGMITPQPVQPTQEEDEVDEAQENRIAQKAAEQVWNRFLVPDAGFGNRPFRDALGETLDNTQKLLEVVEKQQEQIAVLTKLVLQDNPDS